MAKEYRDFLEAIKLRESSGNYQVVNGLQYLGGYQMGEAALIDAGYIKRDSSPNNNDFSGGWTGKNGIYSTSDFLNNPHIQDIAIQDYYNVLWRYIEHFNLDNYIGLEIGGILISESGLIAGAHLVGVGELKKFLDSEGAIIPQDGNGTPITEYMDEFGGFDTPYETETDICPEGGYLNGLLNALDAAHYAPYSPPPGGAPRLGNESPLVIDLDGDGIELTNALTGAVYWDVDNDGFKDASAWVKADDALLVMDRNVNGIIDNHSELFGNQTDGFQILAQLDTNANGKIDSGDAQFAELKIWQDLNQDGVSQADELKTLAQAGISSINLDAKTVNYQVEGNDVTSSSYVTMSDGSTRTIVDAWFKYNDANTMYGGEYTLDPRSLYLPTLRGYGELKDLTIAMSMNEKLLKHVEELSGMSLATVLNPDGNFDSEFRSMLYAWSSLNTPRPAWDASVFQYDSRKTQFIDDISGRNYSDGALIAGQLYTYEPTMLTGAWELALTNLEARFLTQTVFSTLFTGSPIYNINTDMVEGITGISSIGLASIASIINASSDKDYGWTLVARVIEGSLGISNLAIGDYNLINSTLDSSVPGLTLSTLLDHVTEGMADAGVIAGTTGTNNTLVGNAADNIIEGRDQNDTLFGGAGDDRMFGQQGDDTYFGGTGDDLMFENNVYSSNDIYHYGGGDDIIIDPLGYDKIVFGPGITINDITLHRPNVLGQSDLEIKIAGMGTILVKDNWEYYGSSKMDRLEFADSSYLDLTAFDGTINGTAGNDNLVGSDNNYMQFDHLVGGDGNDTLNGGAGDDYLEGGLGDDTYVYDFYEGIIPGTLGSGYDVIYETGGDNTLVLNGISNPNAISFDVVGDSYGSANMSLLIKYNDVGIVFIDRQFNNPDNINTIVISGAFSIDVPNYQFDQVNTSQASDYMVGIQYGGSPNNRMFAGGSGDRLYGGDGDDLLVGGGNNDTLEGGTGNDNYVYNVVGPYGLLFGDMIVDTGGTDTITINDLPDPNQITINRNVDNFGLDIRYSGLQIIYIADHFVTNKAVESLVISGVGGTTINLGAIANVTGDSGDNNLVGNDNARMDDDIIYGLEGNDTLTGGAGDDILYGGQGDDTYVYTSGIDRYDEEVSGGNDTILFGAGILEANLSFSRSGTYDLNIFVNGQLAIIVKNQFESGPNSIIETIKFYDNSTIALGSYNYTFNGTSGYDTIAAPSTGSGDISLFGLDGGDTLTTYAGNDILDGGIGTDTLYAGEGADKLIYTYNENIGYNDYYYGQQGSDTLQINIQSSDLTDVIFNDLVAYKNYLANPSNIDVNELYGAQYNFTAFGLSASRFEVLKVLIDEVEVSLSSLNSIVGTNSAETLNGSANADITFGKDGNDTIVGNNGNDILIGGAGNDAMTGGAGNDTYVVDSSSDTTVEASGGGTDLVVSSVTISGLASNVENLTLTGASAINGTGNTLNNTIIGNSANNTLNGAAGNDNMSGGLGDDIYVVDSSSDIVNENADSGTDTVQSTATFTLSNNVENITLTGTSAINATGNTLDNVITGNSGNNTLTGNAGNDTIIGGGGVDTMIGGLGDDVYTVDSTTDVVTESSSEGTDTIKTSVTLATLATNVENLTLLGTGTLNATGNSLDNILTGNTGNNTLTGNDGNDTLIGGGGTDTMVGGLGNDIYVVDSTSDIVTEAVGAGTDTIQSSVTITTMAANVENLTLTGSAAINVTGNGLNNILIGNTNANTISGGAGNDTMIGGAGNDIYVVDSASDVVTELANEGTDLIQSSVTYTLSANVENITLTGSSAINATGNTLDNTITGNTGNNTLIGGGGSDTLVGGTGNDTYIVDSIGDIVTEAASSGTDLVKSSISYTLTANVENLTLLGFSAINATGNTLANILTGNASNNTLSGGTGNDTMIGGLGDDTYIVDSTSDVVTESASEGTDSVQSSATFTLSVNVENLTLTGSSAINGTGNALDNIIIGNSANNILTGNDGNDTLDGGAGNDTMVGGLGNDTYIVNSVSDVTTEAANAGIDHVKSSVTYTTATNVENLTLTGTSAINGTGNALDNVIIGNSGNNTLTGNDGNDTLDGGAGNDTMVGGLGNDTFVVDSLSDVVTEAASAGTDTVRSYITLTLGTNLENLTLIGSAAINGIGNTVNNILTGNAANNTLDGGTGADTMIGGYGDDIYIVDNASDVVTEDANSGTDQVQTSLTYTLATNVENLTLTGTSAINGTGNTLDNVIMGNSGNNTLTGNDGNDTLDGGLGNDILIGGLGDDIFIIDNASDVVTESSGQGTDTVRAAFTYTILANFENLTLTGSSAINGTGNSVDNVIMGNIATNILNGGDGNDTLIGGGGNDTFIGALGNDTFIHSTGLVTISETTGGTDTLKITGGITINEITSSQIGNNAKIVIASGSNEITLTNQHNTTTSYHVERIEFDDGFSTTLEDHLNWTKGNSLDNTFNGTSSHNTIIGYAGNDTLDGAGGDDDIHGGSGNDLLKGGSGIDLLHGGIGNDILYGQDGLDTLIGGAGSDIFVFESSSAFNNIDVIKDFNNVEGDVLNISDLLTDYIPGISDINDYVSLTTTGTDTNLFIDRDGSGTTYSSVQIVTLSNASGLDVDALLINKNLVV
jgi:Ca2+-binding RTX toxin-like protein